MSIDTLNKDPRKEASRWAERLMDSDLTAAERHEFQRWLMADDLHQREFRAHLSILNLARDLPRDGIDDLVSLAIQDADERPPRRKAWMWGLAASLMLSLSVASWFAYQYRGPSTTYVTVAGMTRDIRLPDGSVVHLNSQTELRWIGRSGERKVALLRGEALFEVKHDPTKPFTVAVDSSEVRVLGTRFNVHRRASAEVVVTVLEGIVQVSQAQARGSARPAWTRTLNANEQLVYNGSGLVRDIYVATGANAAKWREGILEFDDEPLANIVEDLGRYTDRDILIRDPRLGHVRMGGQLSGRDVKGSLDRIAKLAPVTVQESGNTFILDYRQEPTKETH